MCVCRGCARGCVGVGGKCVCVCKHVCKCISVNVIFASVKCISVTVTFFSFFLLLFFVVFFFFFVDRQNTSSVFFPALSN